MMINTPHHPERAKAVSRHRTPDTTTPRPADGKSRSRRCICMFLPRSLSSHRSTKSHSKDQPNPLPQPTATARQSAADEIPAEDPTILCALAFSDHELWSNPSLRDPNRDGCKLPLTLIEKKKEKLE